MNKEDIKVPKVVTLETVPRKEITKEEVSDINRLEEEAAKYGRYIKTVVFLRT